MHSNLIMLFWCIMKVYVRAMRHDFFIILWPIMPTYPICSVGELTLRAYVGEKCTARHGYDDSYLGHHAKEWKIVHNFKMNSNAIIQIGNQNNEKASSPHIPKTSAWIQCYSSSLSGLIVPIFSMEQGPLPSH